MAQRGGRRCRKPDEKPFEYRGLGDDEPFLDLCRQAQSESELEEADWEEGESGGAELVEAA